MSALKTDDIGPILAFAYLSPVSYVADTTADRVE